MKPNNNLTKIVFASVLTILLNLSFAVLAKAADKYYYQLRIYHIKTKAQEDRLDAYLQKAYLPALHKAGIKNIGVFKPVDQDTTADKRVYLFIPYKNWDQLENTDKKVWADQDYQNAGKDYIDALYNDVPYTRFETIVLKAFPKMLSPDVPKLTSKKLDRVYELRSYEGPTEKYYINKVKMFNDGDEVGLFKRLNFNAVFYGDVLSGSRMPNLMYMTTFENKQDRDEHWKKFGDDPQWKGLVADPQYQHNVSKADIIFLHPAEYSDF